MSILKQRIAAMIEDNGPISLATYMALCLMDTDHGYYTNATPFGQEGDFITAPEVSQMFGELLGAWVVTQHQKCRIKGAFTLCEMGPGRGTLMADMLRTLQKIAPSIFAPAHIALLEASPKLREKQTLKLKPFEKDIQFLDKLEALPDQPTLFIGNEFFDALPIRQYIRQNQRWHERLVTLSGEDFTLQAAPLPEASTLGLLEPASDGTIAEICTPALTMMEWIAHHIEQHKGAGLFIDYGHLKSGTGDTLQAVSNHKYTSLFEAPGKADLTAHVDFDALSRVAKSAGLETILTTQGAFLLKLGLLERAGQLGAGKPHAQQEEIRDAVERLAAPDQMGELFKVMEIMP